MSASQLMTRKDNARPIRRQHFDWMLVFVALSVFMPGCGDDDTRDDTDSAIPLVTTSDSVEQVSSDDEAKPEEFAAAAPAEDESSAATEEPEEPIDGESQQILDDATDETVDQVLGLLKHSNPAVRRAAADALSTFVYREPTADNVLQPLADALFDTDIGTRREAARSLAHSEGRAVAVVDKLILALKDNDTDEETKVLEYVAEAIGQCGSKASAAVEPLLAILRTADYDRYEFSAYAREEYAADALGRIGEAARVAIPELVRRLDGSEEVKVALARLGQKDAVLPLVRSSDKFDRGHAATALGFLSPTSPDVIEALTTLLDDEDEWVRGNATQSLGTCHPTTEAVIVALKTAVQDEHEYVRGDALRAMWELDPKPASSFEVLLLALKDSDEGLRDRAARMLGSFPAPTEVRFKALMAASSDADPAMRDSAEQAVRDSANDLLPLLFQIVTDRSRDQDTRVMAVKMLGVLRNQDEQRIGDLMAMQMDAPDATLAVRTYAVGTLQSLERPHPAAFDILSTALNETSDPGLRSFALFSLGQLRDARTVPLLVEALAAEDEGLVLTSVIALGMLGSPAASSVPELCRLLGDDSLPLPYRSAVAKALGQIAAGGEHSLPALIRVLKSDNNELRQSAALAIGEVASRHTGDVTGAVNTLAALLVDRDILIGREAAMSLKRLGPRAVAAVPTLIDALRADEMVVRLSAAEALGGIGESASSAVPALENALEDERPDVRKAATEALAQIRPNPSMPSPR